MSRWNTLFFALVVALLSSGCATIGSVQRANTMGKGNWQVGLEPGAKGISAEGGLGFIPDVSASFRAGVSDRVDVGGRIGQNLYDVHMKYQFTDPESTGPVISIAPSFSIAAVGGGGSAVLWGQFNLPVLIGLPVGQSQVVFGPRIFDTFFGAGTDGGGGVGHLLFVGSSFGFAARAGERFSILPELTVGYPVLAGAGVSIGGEGSSASAGNTLGSGLLLEFKLGFLIGSQ